MSTNSLVVAIAAAASTVALSLSFGVAPNVAAPLGLLIGGITALILFVNSPAAVPAVPIASAPAKKSKKAAKKEAAVKRPPTPPVYDESNSDASVSELSEDDAEESAQSKNAKKKAKKKQKEAEAKAAAAAAAKKAEEEKKKAAKKAAAPAPAPAAAPVNKKDESKKASKKTKEEKKAAAAPVPAPRTPSPPPQVEEEEEEFQTSKASKKKAKQDAKKAEKKEVDVTAVAAAPKKAAVASTAPSVVAAATNATATKKSEKKAAAPAPVAEKPAEDDGWETAKAAKPTIAQKQAAKVANAEKKVEEINTVNTASDVYSEFVDIPARAVPAIIGSKGAVLKALQEGTQAKIEIPPASARAIDSLTVRVIVSGEPDAVRYAKTCVKSLAEKGFSAVTHPGFVSDDIYVESKQHGFIIGPKGTTLKTIQTKSGTRIQMPERGGNDRVLIVGPKEGVKAAKEAIKQLIADGFSSMTHEGTEKKEVEYPREKIGWLIGANGQTIKSIQGNTECKINIPRDNSNFVIIVGPAAKIAQAEKEIKRTLEPKEKKGKKIDDTEEEDAEEKEADAAEPEGPQGAYDAWPSQQETATTEDQLWAEQ